MSWSTFQQARRPLRRKPGSLLIALYCTIVMLDVLLMLMVFFLMNGIMSG